MKTPHNSKLVREATPRQEDRGKAPIEQTSAEAKEMVTADERIGG